MKMPKIMLDFSLLKENPNFRMVFIARMMSILALGMMTVAVPIQIHQMTGSTLQVGMIMALDGIGMFVGLLIGGVLADKYDRRKLILFARTTCGIGFGALALNSLLAESSLVALYVLSVWDGFFWRDGNDGLDGFVARYCWAREFALSGGTEHAYCSHGNGFVTSDWWVAHLVW